MMALGFVGFLRELPFSFSGARNGKLSLPFLRVALEIFLIMAFEPGHKSRRRVGVCGLLLMRSLLLPSDDARFLVIDLIIASAREE